MEAVFEASREAAGRCCGPRSRRGMAVVRVVRGRLIKTRESFSRRMRRRARREETSLNLFRSGLQRERGALVTPSCTVSAVTAPPALYYESNLSRREATPSWAGATEVRGGLRG